MKVGLITAGGALVAAVAVAGMAGPASAHPHVCDPGFGGTSATLGINGGDVSATSHDARACLGDGVGNDLDSGLGTGLSSGWDSWNGYRMPTVPIARF